MYSELHFGLPEKWVLKSGCCEKVTISGLSIVYTIWSASS